MSTSTPRPTPAGTRPAAAWYDRVESDMLPDLPTRRERVEAAMVRDARCHVYGGRAHDVPASRILNGDPDAHRQAQVPRFAQWRDPPEPGQFEPSDVHCSCRKGVEQRRETRQALI